MASVPAATKDIPSLSSAIQQLAANLASFFQEHKRNQTPGAIINLIKVLVNGYSQLSRQDARDVAREIFFPYAFRSLNENSQQLGLKMALLVKWWFSAKPPNVPPKSVQCVMQHVFEGFVNGRPPKESTQTQAATLRHIFRLFSCQSASGHEVNCLIELVSAYVNFKREFATGDSVTGTLLAVKAEDFSTLWRPYFMLLTISNVVSPPDRQVKEDAKGKLEFQTTGPITVNWSDGRQDTFGDGRVLPRKRVNDLVHQMLGLCVSSCEQGVALLEPLVTSIHVDTDIKFILQNWISLFQHVASLPIFEKTMLQKMFDVGKLVHFPDVPMEDQQDTLQQLFDLFGTFQKMEERASDLIAVASHEISSLIVRMLLGHDEKSKAAFAEQVTVQVCGRTPSNPQGQLCFYSLLNSLLLSFQKANLYQPFKAVLTAVIEFYADYLLTSKLLTDSSAQYLSPVGHQQTLFTILKGLTLHTDTNFLHIWIHEAASDHDEELTFQLIADSLPCLRIYVEQCKIANIHELLVCIASSHAVNHIPQLLHICEGVSKRGGLIKRTLFNSNMYLSVLQWLSHSLAHRDFPHSVTWRVVSFLLEIARETDHQHVKDEISENLNVEHLLEVRADDNRPLNGVLLYLSTSSVDLSRKFWQVVFSRMQDPSDVAASHFLRLSIAVVSSAYSVDWLKILHPFMKEVLTLLAHNNEQVRRACENLFAHLYQLNQNERSVLSDSLADPCPSSSSATGAIQEAGFFSSEINEMSKKAAARNGNGVLKVKRSNFVKAQQFLEDLGKAGSVEEVDVLLRNWVPLQFQGSVNISPGRLIFTATTRENVTKVLEAVKDPTPLILEGSTGVGKSASVTEAATICGQKLVRFNMSSRVGIDDLLGKVSITQGATFCFVDGPFTTAFSHGYWLLLDELNLAQDTVLQVIESALDTGQLTIHNTSSAQESIIQHRIHSQFRLFATQNPNAGFFKGKRETLSASFLSRFRPMIFHELPESEWREIVQEKLSQKLNPADASSVSELMVITLNSRVKRSMTDTGEGNSFPEMASYCECSIRELLKWLKHILWQSEKVQWQEDMDARLKFLTFSAWCVYGARFRQQGRARMKSIISEAFKVEPNLIENRVEFSLDVESKRISLDDVSCDIAIDDKPVDKCADEEWSQIFPDSERNSGNSVPFNGLVWSRATQVHKKVRHCMFDVDFILQHGIYRIERVWLWEWLRAAKDANVLAEESQLALMGCRMYQSRLRHEAAKAKIYSCFVEVFKEFVVTAQNFPWLPDLENPFVLTHSALSILKQIIFSQRIKNPILLTGGEGCGKSDLVLALAWFQGKRVHQLNVTPETETSAFIGQLVPNQDRDLEGEKFVWQHGAVTQAFLNGEWALLDNFGMAESSVLERMNPILEEQPVLILTEKGDVDPVKQHENYQLLATLTPVENSQGGESLGISELSPALYNRFSVIHMQDNVTSRDALLKDEELMRNELTLLAQAFLSDEPTRARENVQLAVQVCVLLLRFFAQHPHLPKLSLRNITRLLDSSYRLQLKFPDTLQFASSLWTAYHVTIVHQVKDASIRNALTGQVSHLLQQGQPADVLKKPPFMHLVHLDEKHVITPSREEYLCAILGSVISNIPVLLEGPSAVGKTALITHICKNMKGWNGQKLHLERVNNTDTTSVQDYLGTFIPASDGFVFKKGALYRAMVNGSWFLADEFNLADPAVMNMLFPLLEGKKSITIPTSGSTVTAKKGFHFFATQNDASYANRNRLPTVLRNRFSEIQFSEFPQEELADIILKRDDHFKTPCLSKDSAKELATFYHRAMLTKDGRITFREIIKWLHRQALFSPQTPQWPVIGGMLLCGKYPPNAETRKHFAELLEQIWPRLRQPSTENTVEVRQISNTVVSFKEGQLEVEVENASLERSPLLNPNQTNSGPPMSFKQALVRLAFAVQAKEPVLLIGPSSCKSLLIETWARIIGRQQDLVKVHLNSDTEAADLIGEIRPFSFLDLLNHLPLMIRRVLLRLKCLTECSNNEWDSQLQEIEDVVFGELSEAIREFERDYKANELRRIEDEAEMEHFTVAVMSSSMTQEASRHLGDLADAIDPWKPWNDVIEEFDSEEDSEDHISRQLDPVDYVIRSDVQLDTDFDDGFNDIDMQVMTEALDDTRSTAVVTDEVQGDEEDFFTQNPAPTVNVGSINPFDLTGDSYDDGFSHISSAFSTDDNSTTVYDIPIPSQLANCVDKIMNLFQNVFQHQCSPQILHESEYSKFIELWQQLSAEDCDHSKPFFLFQDGPVTKAVKEGGILLLEDIDLPSQAVVERLNPMLELSPVFAVTEDITALGDNVENTFSSEGQLEITLSSKFHIFATVHQEHDFQIVRLSPAMRSRFTEIRVGPYSSDEIKNIVADFFKSTASDEQNIETPSHQLTEVFLSLRDHLLQHCNWKTANDIHLMFRCFDLIRSQHHSLPLEHRLFLAMRFVYFDQLPLEIHESVFISWCQTSFDGAVSYREIFLPPSSADGSMTLDSALVNPFTAGTDWIGMRYTSVRYTKKPYDGSLPSVDELQDRLRCVPTSTFLNQLARIFAAASSSNPLLLEGPPGIGKTQVVTQFCKLLNKQCEHINLSANTSLDQLIGCIIPRCSEGRRVFQWQDGKLLQALKQRHCILLDELNLASPEVLEGLVPLFYRTEDAKIFTVPATGERIDISDLIIFATMNPVSLGGGRCKLPRFIINLFTVVQFEDYTADEVRIILQRLFEPGGLTPSKISPGQLDELFALHCELKEDVKQGELGRGSGLHEMNLRDLTKFRDVFRGSIDNQLQHFQYFHKDSTTLEEEGMKNKSANSSEDHLWRTTVAIRKFAQVVYAYQFQGLQDISHVCDKIDRRFPIPVVARHKIEDNLSIDASQDTVVRIGSIYIKTGTEQSTKACLIHTQGTVKQMELLAAACQSTRTILLEGDTCSRKTSLVVELACVTRHRLVVIPLHENFETSDLIGSWLPNQSGFLTEIHGHSVFQKIDKLYHRLVKFLVLVCKPFLSAEYWREVVSQVEGCLRYQPVSDTEEVYKHMITNEIGTLGAVELLLKKLNDVSDFTNDHHNVILCYIRQTNYFKGTFSKLHQKCMEDGKMQTGFTFVESEFVQAIREGAWVLLDNVNSAPPEIIERFNSLLEDRPMLSLYEDADGEVLTRENGGIHSDFRLFTTANLNRIHSNKLSSAFLNRVIRIWLPPLDDGIANIQPAQLSGTDVYEMIAAQFSPLPAGKELTHLLLLTHSKVKDLTVSGTLLYPKDFTVTYRLVEQCAKTTLHLVEEGTNAVDALMWAILRSYGSALNEHSQYQLLVSQLWENLSTLDLPNKKTFSSSMVTYLETIPQPESPFQKEKEIICQEVVTLETTLTRLLLNMLLTLGTNRAKDSPASHEWIMGLVQSFTEEICVRMQPRNQILLDLKKKTMEHCSKELSTILETLKCAFGMEDCPEETAFWSSWTVQRQFKTLCELAEDSLPMLCKNISIKLSQFIVNTSCNDIPQRTGVVERIVETAETFRIFLISHLLPNNAPLTKVEEFLYHILTYLRPILAFKRNVLHFQWFREVSFMTVRREFMEMVCNKHGPGSAWTLERPLSLPMAIGCEEFAKLLKIMPSVDDGHCEDDQASVLRKFPVLVQCAGLRWLMDTLLTPNVRALLHDEILVSEVQLRECDCRLACETAAQQLQQLVENVTRDLPSDVRSLRIHCYKLHNSLQQKKAKLPALKETCARLRKEMESEKCMATEETAEYTEVDQNSLIELSSKLDGFEIQLIQMKEAFDAESNMFKEAMKERDKALQMILKQRQEVDVQLTQCLQSSCFKLVQQTAAEERSRCLNDLVESLFRCEKTGYLAARGEDALSQVLATDFGDKLADQTVLVGHPLMFFLCGVFFAKLPLIVCDLATSVHVISRWEDFPDLKKLRNTDLIFHCSPGVCDELTENCCMLRVDNNSQSYSTEVTVWSIRGMKTELEKLNNYLNMRFPFTYVHMHHLRLEVEIAVKEMLNRSHWFSWGCLHSLLSEKEATVNELHLHVLSIYSELQRRVTVNEKGRLPSYSCLLVQHVEEFYDELHSLPTSSEWAMAEEFTQVMFKYQKIFSKTRVSRLKNELAAYKRAVLPPFSKTASLATLAFLQTMVYKYSYALVLISVLKESCENGNETYSQKTESGFLGLFQLLSMSSNLLNLVTQMATTENILILMDDNYPNLLKLFAHLKHILLTVLPNIDFQNGELLIQKYIEKSWFNDCHATMTRNLRALGITPDYVTSMSRLLEAIRPVLVASETGETSLQCESDMACREDHSSIEVIRREVMLKQCIRDLEKLIENYIRDWRCNVPAAVLNRVHATLESLRRCDCGSVVESVFEKQLRDAEGLKVLCEECALDAATTSDLQSRMPKPPSVRALIPEEIQATSFDNDTLLDDAIEGVCMEINKLANPSRELNIIDDIVVLTDARIDQQTLMEALHLISSASSESPDAERLQQYLNRLKSLHAPRIYLGKQPTVDHITSVYAQFRLNALRNAAATERLSNYEAIAKMSRDALHWDATAQVNVMNIFPTVELLTKNVSAACRHFSNILNDQACILLPLFLRPEDLFCLLAPERSVAIEKVCLHSINLDHYLSQQEDEFGVSLPSEMYSTRSTVPPSSGISSFHGTNGRQLFDENRVVLFLLDSVNGFSQDLLHLCAEAVEKRWFLIKACAMIEELFPIEIGVASGLLVFTTWIASKNGMVKENVETKFMKEISDKVTGLQQELCRRKQLLANKENEKSDLEMKLKLSTSVRSPLIDTISMQPDYLGSEIEVMRKEIQDIEEELRKEMASLEDVRIAEQSTWTQEFFCLVGSLEQLVQRSLVMIRLSFESTVPSTKTNTSHPKTLSESTTFIVETTRHLMAFSPQKPASLSKGHKERVQEILSATDVVRVKMIEHSTILAETNVVYRFCEYLTDLLLIAKTSLWHALHSWFTFCEALKSESFINYAKNSGKNELCGLGKFVQTQGADVVVLIRGGHETEKVVRCARDLCEQVHVEVTNLCRKASGQSSYVESFRNFNIFIVDFLLNVCRYSQLQHGVHEPVEDLLEKISPNLKLAVTFTVPVTELALSQRLEMFEQRLATYSNSCLALNLHIAFQFCSNSLELLEALGKSIGDVSKLVLPATSMLSHWWNKWEEQVGANLNKGGHTDEKKSIMVVCTAFHRISEMNSTLQDAQNLVCSSCGTQHLISLFKAVQEAVEVIVSHRPRTKLFWEDFSRLQQAVMKEVARGLLKCQMHVMNGKLEKRSSAISAQDNYSLVVDARHLLSMKSVQPSCHNSRLSRVHVSVQLLLGGLKQLETSVMALWEVDNVSADMFVQIIGGINKILQESHSVLFAQLKPLLKSTDNQCMNHFQVLELFRSFTPELHANCLLEAIKAQLQKMHDFDLDTLGERIDSEADKFQTAIDCFVEKKRRAAEKCLLEVKSSWSSKLYNRSTTIEMAFNEATYAIASFMNRSQQKKSLPVCQLADQKLIKRLENTHRRFHHNCGDSCVFVSAFKKTSFYSVLIVQKEKSKKTRSKIILAFFTSKSNKPTCLRHYWRGNKSQLCVVVDDKTEFFNANSPNKSKQNRESWVPQGCQQRSSNFFVEFQRSTAEEGYVSLIESDTDKELKTKDEILKQLLRVDEAVTADDCEKEAMREGVRFADVCQQMKRMTTELKTKSQLSPAKAVPFESVEWMKHLATKDYNLDHIRSEFSRLHGLCRYLNIRVIEETEITTNSDIHTTWIPAMDEAWKERLRCLLQMEAAFDQLTTRLCFVKAFALNRWCYQITIMKEPLQTKVFYSAAVCLRRLFSLLPNDPQGRSAVAECKQILINSEDVLRAYSNSLSLLPAWERRFQVDTNIIDAFASMDIGYHCWLDMAEQKVNSEDVDKVDEMTCVVTLEPLHSRINFGYFFPGDNEIEKRCFSLHNISQNEMIVQVIHNTPSSFSTDLKPFSIAAKSAYQLEVQFEVPSELGQVEHVWDLHVDSHIMSKAIQVCAQVLKMDVELETDVIDFGTIPCDNQPVLRAVQVSNKLPTTLSVYFQLQEDIVHQQMQSKLEITSAKLITLAHGESQDLVVQLLPGSVVEKLERDVCLAVNSHKHLKWVKITGKVERPEFTVELYNCTIFNSLEPNKIIGIVKDIHICR